MAFIKMGVGPGVNPCGEDQRNRRPPLPHHFVGGAPAGSITTMSPPAGVHFAGPRIELGRPAYETRRGTSLSCGVIIRSVPDPVKQHIKLITLKTGKKFRTHDYIIILCAWPGQGGLWWGGWWVAGFDPVAFTLLRGGL
jgi:hypothetical protein